MSKKIGRNAPCPCGSGKKYKKCCLGKDKIDDKVFPRDLLDYAGDWILRQPKLEHELDKVLKEHAKDNVVTDIEFSNIMDAFIFDHKLSNGKTPFRFFLDNAKLSSNDYSTYNGFEDNVFSIFEVLDIYKGQGIKLQDLVWNKEYFVREKKGTYQLKPGYILFCRIVIFKSYFVIITPAPNVWPKDASYLIKRKLRYMRSDLQKRGMIAFDILGIMREYEDKPESLDEIKQSLKKQLNSLGIKIDFRGLDRRINENANMMDAFPEVYEFNFPSNDDFNETMDILQLLWNKYPRKEFEGKSPEEVCSMGPKEQLLTSDLLDETMRNIDPNDYPSKEEAEKAINKFRDKWLKTPQKELDGRTPMNVILKERRELGNPEKDFTLRIEITGLINYDENKAERLYMEGIQAFKQGALIKAAELFEEVTDMYPENYKAWGNLGNCFAYLGHKKEGIKCYKKALSLEPDYDFAKKNLELIKSQTEKQLTTMATLGALRTLMHDVDKKRKGEEIDVWKEIDKEMKNASKRK